MSDDQMALEFSPAVAHERDGDGPLSDEERRVIETLRSHRGRALAIKAPALACAAGVTQRQLRATIEHLIEHHHAAIGSTTQPPFGYYMIETAEDAEHACEHLRHKALSILRRMANIKRTTLPELMGQLSLGLRDEG